jgi:hypothetical protein
LVLDAELVLQVGRALDVLQALDSLQASGVEQVLDLNCHEDVRFERCSSSSLGVRWGGLAEVDLGGYVLHQASRRSGFAPFWLDSLSSRVNVMQDDA